VPPAWDQRGAFYNWKSKFGGLDVSEARRLKRLEGENARLKKLLANSMLDNAALKDLVSKNGDARSEARGRRPSAASARDERAAACRVIGCVRMTVVIDPAGSTMRVCADGYAALIQCRKPIQHQ
jgi:Transposase